jgi:hypothetical protein
MPSKDLAGAQGPGKVCVQDALPLIFRKIKSGRALDFPGAVDEDVRFAEMFQRLPEKVFQRGAVADVRGHAQGAPAPGLDFVCCLFKLFLAAR